VSSAPSAGGSHDGSATHRLRYVLYGAGAVGGVIGGRLFEAGHDVTFVARGDHGRALRAHGLTLADPDRNECLAVPAVEHPSELAWDGGDIVILAMKTQDTEPALRDLASVAPPGVAVVCAQNGVENERLALRRFADVYAMCVMLPGSHVEPGTVIVHSAPVPGILDIGRYPTGSDTVAGQIANDLETSGFSSRPSDSIMRSKYAKLLMNLGNALEATTGGDGAQDSGGADARIALYGRARTEAEACFAAAGIDAASDEEDRERRGDLLRIRRVDGQRRGGGSSWQSLARGTGAIETDHLNGEIVLLGRQHGVPTPANELLQRTANRMARDHAEPGSVPAEQLLQELDAVR